MAKTRVSSFARSIVFTLCLALIGSGLFFPASTPVSQAQSSGLRRQLPPNYALPKINDLLTEGRKLQRPDLPRPALKPSTLCGFHDKACKFKQAKEKKVGQNLRTSEQNAPQVAANAGQVQNWLGRIGQMISHAFNASPFGIPSISAAERKSFAASNTLRPATNAAATSMLFTPPNFASLYEARIDPRYRAGTPGEDLFSGNVNYSLPLVSLPGRNGLDLNLSLSFNSAIWFKYSGQMYFDPNYYETLTPGFRLGFPEIEGPFNLTTGETFLVTLPSGKRVEMRIVPSTTNQYEAVDSSYLYLVVNTTDPNQMTLYATDGTQFKYELPTNGYWSRCTQIKDSNGNYISIAYKSIGDPEWPLVVTDKVTDTLGREIVFNYDEYLHLQSITQAWQNQTFIWAQFEYGTQAVTPNFGSLGISGPSGGDLIPVITRIITGDGARHTFVYNSWGQAEDFWLYGEADNQRAALDYAFPSNSTAQSDCPRPTQRNDYIANWGGATGNGWVSSYFSYDSANETYGQITDPDGVTHKEIFNTTSGKRGLPSRMETWYSSAIQKFTDITWASDVSSGRPLRPRVTDTQICDDRNNDGYYNGTDKLSRTAISYTTLTSTQVKLPVIVKQYNEGGQSVYRTAETTYVTDTNYTGITRRIIGLPSLVKLYEGDSTTLKAQTEFVYDSANESGTTFLQAHSNQVRQHDSTSNGTAGNYGTNFSYRGNLTKTKRYSVTSGSASSPIEARVGYYITGTPAFSKDALNHQTSLGYDDSFLHYTESSGTLSTTTVTPSPATYAYPTKVTSPAETEYPSGVSSTVSYNYDFGGVTRTVDPKEYALNGSSPQTMGISTYDSKGRLDKSLVWKGNQKYSQTRQVYGTDHNYAETWTTINSLTEETFVVHLLDGVGRERITIGEHPGSTGTLKLQYLVFDKMGRVSETSNPTEIDGYWAPAGDDSSGYAYSQQAYDWKGRPTITTNQNGTTRQINYTGCGCAGSDVTEYWSEDGLPRDDSSGTGRRKTKVYRDVHGRVAKTENLDWDGNVYSTATSTFTVLDQVTSAKQYQGTGDGTSCSSGTCQETAISYDGYGRVSTRKRPVESTSTGYTYYADDRVQTITDARGAVTTFAYNNRGLRLSAAYTPSSGVTATPTATFQYDERGNRTQMNDGPGAVTYEYDSLGRLTSESRTFDQSGDPSGSFAISYEYNLAGQIKKVTDPFAAAISYTFDRSGRLTGVTGTSFGGETSYLSNVVYRAWNATKTITYNTLESAQISYSSRMLPAHYELTNKASVNYSYNNDGNPNEITGLSDAKLHQTFKYDFLGRKTWAKADGGGSDPQQFDLLYAHSAFGHMTNKQGGYWFASSSGYAATYQDDRITTANQAGTPLRVTYDNSGNTLQTEKDPNNNNTWQLADGPFRYDVMGQVTGEGTVSGSNPDQIRFYDGDGAPVKLAPGGTTASYYVRSSALGGQVLTTLGGSGGKLTTEVFANGEILATQCVGCGATGQDLVKSQRRDPYRTLDLSQSVYMMDPLGIRVQPATQQQINGGQGQQPPPVNPGNYYSASTIDAFGTANNAMTCRLEGRPVPCDKFFRDAANGGVDERISVSTTGGLGGVGGNTGAIMAVLGNIATSVNGERLRDNPDYNPDLDNPGPKYLPADLSSLAFGFGAGFGLTGGQELQKQNPADPLMVKDDAGRWCKPSEITKDAIVLWNKEGFGGSSTYPHTFIQSPKGSFGYYPSTKLGGLAGITAAGFSLGEMADDSNLLNKSDYKAAASYSACPESVAALIRTVDKNKTGFYGMIGSSILEPQFIGVRAYNCTTWACQMLKNAGFSPPASPFWPILLPSFINK